MVPWRRRIDGTVYVPENLAEGTYDFRVAMLDPRTAPTSDSFCHRGPPGRRLVWHRVIYGEKAVKHFTLRRARRGGRSTEDPRELQPGRMIRSCIMAMLGGNDCWCALAADEPATAGLPCPSTVFAGRGHESHPSCNYQAEQAWERGR